MKPLNLALATLLTALLLFTVFLFLGSSSIFLPFVTWAGSIEPTSEDAYVNARSTVMQKYEQDLPHFYAVLVQSFENPAVAGDKVWQYQMHDAAQKVQRHGQQLRRLEAPSNMRTSHQELLSFEQDQTECAIQVIERLRLGDGRTLIQPSMYCGRAIDGLESYVGLLASGQWEPSHHYLLDY